MSRRKTFTRRAFLGKAAAAAAVVPTASALAACSPSGTHAATGGGPGHPGHPGHPRRLGAIGENSRQGDPHWRIRHHGAPDAIMGYTGQASVLPGEPVRLYVSTT